MPPLLMILSQLFNYRENYLSFYHFRAKWIKQNFAFVKFILTFFEQNILRYLKISLRHNHALRLMKIKNEITA